MRFYFYALPGHNGKWELLSSLESERMIFKNKERALLAAKSLCRKHWEANATPCGVRVRVGEFEWVDVELVGPASDQIT